ncbi:hypothetical protein LTR10_022343 [Elasticomyces elasticus]|uniref:EthD domain-containing protein n=1 Tax=Exophiala sideris TaxID=1016849 RepID=A0A0D1Y565_9EURO|nr:hypothetical protein LTR10_022343 [Elasticomyces elasticus]KAK5026870.1 hypothetical protein LTS07_007168 [Exophiala sideris]KAK5180816.1 hypothetical protein LTR44_006635 [Eurotiomycetes sp. CCFEE 6388]KAK5033874.1 hypothetical protein LTR13_006473 [Exophiala sideris]KAK5055851.1 hypothetical protein LTR69_008227 [Exophiala sideris]
MTIHATVLYPNEADTKFDMDYYLNKHMPLVMEKFGKHGLKGYQVTEYKPGDDGAKPQFCTGCVLIWDEADHLRAALSSEDAGPVFGDITNFSNKQPVFLGGEVVGQK